MKKSEFKLAVYLLPLAVGVVVLDILFLPSTWMVVSIAAIAVIFMVFVFSNMRATTVEVSSDTRTRQIEMIIRDMPIGVVAYDSNFKILIYNPAARSIFGASESLVLGMTIDAAQASNSELRTLVQVIFSSLAPTVVKLSDPGAFPQIADISFQDPVVDLHVITDRILDASGAVVGFIKLITDLTRENQLLKSKTEFIGVAAHQLRTPLTAVNWALEALEGSSLTDDQKQFVDTAFSAVKNSLNTVNSLLDVSKIEEGKFGYELKTVPFLPFLDEILKQAYDLGKQYNISVYFNRPKEDRFVRADVQKLGMVFYNLLDNAIKYNVENGSVTVSISFHDDAKNLVVNIADTGIGIPAQQLEKLFGKFFRADNAIKTVADGNGLGLYIARNIVRNHGGDITVTSELNRGTTFSVTLPTTDNQDNNPLGAVSL